MASLRKWFSSPEDNPNPTPFGTNLALDQLPIQSGKTLPIQGGDYSGLPVQGGDYSGLPVQGGNYSGLPIQGGDYSGLPIQGGDYSNLSVDELPIQKTGPSVDQINQAYMGAGISGQPGAAPIGGNLAIQNVEGTNSPDFNGPPNPGGPMQQPGSPQSGGGLDLASLNGLMPQQAAPIDLQSLAAALNLPTTGDIQGQVGSILSGYMSALGPLPQIPNYDPAQLAQSQIALQYGPQEAAARQNIHDLQQSVATQTAQQQGYAGKADTALQNIFQALQQSLGQNAQQNTQNYQNAQQAVGGSYDQAQQSLGGLNDRILQQLRGSAGQLGIQQGLQGNDVNPNSPIARIEGGYQGMAQQNLANKANSLASLQAAMANQQGLDTTIQGSAQRQGATARSDIQAQVMNALSQLGNQSAMQQGDILSQYNAMEAGKPLAQQQAQMQLAQNLYNMQMAQRGQQTQELTGFGGLANQTVGLGLQAGGQRNSALEALANLALTQRGQTQDYNIATSPLKGLEGLANLQHLNAGTALDQARAGYYNAGGAKGANSTSMVDLQNMLASPQQGLWGDTGAGPNFSNALLATSPATSGPLNGLMGLIPAAEASGKATGIDPYTYAAGNAPVYASKAGLDLNGLMQALQTYFKPNANKGGAGGLDALMGLLGNS